MVGLTEGNSKGSRAQFLLFVKAAGAEIRKFTVNTKEPNKYIKSETMIKEIIRGAAVWLHVIFMRLLIISNNHRCVNMLSKVCPLRGSKLLSASSDNAESQMFSRLLFLLKQFQHLVLK